MKLKLKCYVLRTEKRIKKKGFKWILGRFRCLTKGVDKDREKYRAR